MILKKAASPAVLCALTGVGAAWLFGQTIVQGDLRFAAVAFGGMAAIPLVLQPYWGLIAFLLSNAAFDLVVIPGIGLIGTAVGVVALVGTLLEWTRERWLPAIGLRSRVFGAMVAFVAAAFLTSILAQQTDVALRDALRLLTRFVPLYLIAATQLRSEKRLKVFAWASVVAGLYWFATCIFRFVAQSTLQYESRFYASNIGAVSLSVLAIPLALALLWMEGKPWPRIVLGCLLALFAVGVAISRSRSGLLALVTLTAYVGLRRYRLNRRFWAALLLMGVLLVAVVPESVWTQRYEPAIRLEESSGAPYRFDLWRSALGIFQDHPLFGVGLANSYFYVPSYGYIPDLAVVHNAFLDVAADMGLAGLLPYLAVWGLALFQLEQARRAATRQGHHEQGDMALALQAGLVALLATSLTGSRWTSKQFWMLLGASSAVSYLTSRRMRDLTATAAAKPKVGVPRPWQPRGGPASADRT